ncbi:MAG: LysM peptidoglycan-binding domain-containing protein [Chitinophagaceae bacterium]|nr:LysM peptidoglycan-binding domain-containing protein [Chitinophagaceae bacterium]
MTKNDLFKKIFAAFLFAFSCLVLQINVAFAQQPPWVHTNEPVLPEPQLLPDQFESNDSLNEVDNELAVSDSMQEPKVSFANVDVPLYEDSIYRARLGAMVTPVTLTYNEEVKKYINLYVLNRREQVSRMLGLSKIYFPIFDQVFAQYGVPPEVKYLSIIESALNPHAVSRVGATGMWQFMYGTAKQYGLNINSYVDERKDIIRSTEGAAQYLKSMYDVYGDWLLAIASYNCGPGNVNRAISLSGGNTFWEIRNYLPRETRNYVPAFIAAVYVMTYYELHDLSPDYPKYSFEPITSVTVSDKMSCDQIAKYTGLSMEEFKFLNPGLKCSVIPGGSVCSYECKLPTDRIAMFDASKDSIILYSLNAKGIFEGGYIPGANTTYTVRKGDNLGKIAGKYHVSVTQIKKWNHLHSSTIHVGQKLKINNGHGTSTATASATKKVITPAPPSAKSEVSVAENATGNESNSATVKKTYTVRQGDNLNKIAASQKVSVVQIKEWNNLSSSTIKTGEKLKLYNPKTIESSGSTIADTANEKQPANTATAASQSVSKTTPVTTAKSITYTVKKGDYLGKIAEKHQVTISQIRNWNKLKSTTVTVGQKLKIYPSGSEPLAIAANKPATVASPYTATAKSTGAIKPEAPSNYVYYKARNGDTLWEIAQRHGTTVDEIRKLNGASKCNNLKVGTVLKLSSKG